MDAVCNTGNSGVKFFGYFLLFIIILVSSITILAAVDSTMTSPHGYEKHGSDAIVTRICMDNYGPTMEFINPNRDNNWAGICIIPPETPDGEIRYGIQIKLSNGEELTAFIRQSLKQKLMGTYETDFNEVIKYMASKNWKPMPGYEKVFDIAIHTP